MYGKEMQVVSTEKRERLEARLTPDEKQRLQRAAVVEHRSLSDFVIHAALQVADTTLGAQPVISLSPRDWDHLVAALAAPSEANEVLRRLLTERDPRMTSDA